MLIRMVQNLLPGTRMDFVSNGFKLRQSVGDINTSGGTYIYMAFAENPLVATNGVPGNGYVICQR